MTMTKSRGKTILITGGTGFIGSHVIHKLLDENYEIIILKNSASDTWRIDDILHKVTIYNNQELLNYENLLRTHSVSGIVHMATKYIKYDDGEKEREEMVKVNVLFPTILLKAAIRQKVKFFISTGTFSEYLPSQKPVNEKSPIDPVNFYSATKSIFENILKIYSHAAKIKGITLRLFSPYGEKDNEKIIPLAIKSLIKNNILKTTKGEQKLSFTYVGDIADAYSRAIQFAHSKNFEYEQFNIGASKAYSLIGIIKRIEEMSGRKSRIRIGAISYNKKEIMYMRCDNTKAKKMLHWIPRTSIQIGLKKTYNYYRSYYDTRS